MEWHAKPYYGKNCPDSWKATRPLGWTPIIQSLRMPPLRGSAPCGRKVKSGRPTSGAAENDD